MDFSLANTPLEREQKPPPLSLATNIGGNIFKYPP